MKLKTTIMTLALLQMSMICLGQDSLRIDSELSFLTQGQHNLAALVNDDSCLNCLTNKVSDNPFFHLAVYSGIDYKMTLNKKYTFETGLYLEERSHSGGNNTLSNIVVFPKIFITLQDTLQLSNRKIGVMVKGGDFWDEDVSDMLRLYNIDYQGLIAEFSLDKWSVEFMTIGDLSRNIGLDLHQTYRFSLGYKDRRFKNRSSVTFNEIYSWPLGRHPTKTDFNISNYTRYSPSAEFNIEGQVSVRVSNALSNAIAMGVQANYATDKLKLSSALRYYKSGFNAGYNGSRPRYYDFNGDFVGSQLYPLKNFYRDYSQWAAYTHYGPVDLVAFVLTSQWDKNIYRKLGVFYDVDFNYTYDLTNEKGYVHPFYNAGFQMNLLKNFVGKVSLTNKHMELRNHFQTFAASNLPYISLGFKMTLDPLLTHTKYMKL